jgi:hypothetical protein
MDWAVLRASGVTFLRKPRFPRNQATKAKRATGKSPVTLSNPVGGAEEDRTPDLRIANPIRSLATPCFQRKQPRLSQLHQGLGFFPVCRVIPFDPSFYRKDLSVTWTEFGQALVVAARPRRHWNDASTCEYNSCTGLACCPTRTLRKSVMGCAPGTMKASMTAALASENVWIWRARATDKQRGVAPVEERQGRNLRELLPRKQGATRAIASPAEAGVSDPRGR